uniref:Uncharacterized protein n=1 Tax=Entomoneis paludosa TaxID=265537 RepID=A0A7S2VAX3_9STRA|mmetsp:Transcript_11296/g.23124  ORF Transcript_11296/g.23124 Transcript_11296/m.23124 type:complete len:255 (+) Transcript_11296:154-918(+)
MSVANAVSITNSPNSTPATHEKISEELPERSAPAQAPPLHLGWTQIGKASQETSIPTKDSEWKRCCDRKGCRHGASGGTARGAGRQDEDQRLRRRYSGRVIFCLQDTDPSWFQGYFFPGSGQKPWGLLGTRREIDECLECVDGGYRVVDLTVTTTGSKKEKIRSIDWLGADMMELKHPHVRMRTERLATGTAGATMAEQVFGSLLRQVRAQSDDTRLSTALELFPDIAIVAGTMELLLPIDKDERDLYDMMFED